MHLCLVQVDRNEAYAAPRCPMELCNLVKEVVGLYRERTPFGRPVDDNLQRDSPVDHCLVAEGLLDRFTKNGSRKCKFCTKHVSR